MSEKTKIDPAKELSIYAPVLEQATDYRAKTLEDYTHGGTLLKMLTAAEKQYKAKEDTALIPAKAAVDAIKELFNPGKEKLAACKKNIKDEMERWYKNHQAAAVQEKQKILSDGRTKAETKADKLQAVVEVPTANTRNVRVLKVMDESKIPREFFELNESRLKKFLMEGGTCPGAELVNEKIIVS